jgi:poly-gamma-glutamate capsule biosynthesis protein CapA/YwtB (metallophosphatase superfamily)
VKEKPIIPTFVINFTCLAAIVLPNVVDNSQKIAKLETQKLAKTTSQQITIKAVGDIVAGTNFPDNRLPANPHQLFPKSIRDNLKGSSLLFGNYESTLTNHPNSSKNINLGRVFAFRSPPSYADVLQKAGFNVMSVANNHSMDFGPVGFLDTVKNLNKVGIKAVGEKEKITYLNVDNTTVAMIGFCFYQYCNHVNDIESGKKLITQAKTKAKIIVVSMHVGAEGINAMRVKNETEIFYGENRGNSVNFARKMVDAGADMILGHGPHVPRAMEVYKGKLIAYSLGNFLGYKTLSTQGVTGNSMILEAKVNDNGDFISGNIIPVRLDKIGIPQIDNTHSTVAIVRSLTKSDFPHSPINISPKGQISLKQNIKP